MLKISKSILKIYILKSIKIERYNFHLYGKLIVLFLSTVVVFVHRDELYYEHDK
jgi:hypothetical protein